jgi:hypothetical protein
MRSFLSDPKIDGIIIEPMRDLDLYSSPEFAGSDSVAEGAALAPDAMYDAIREYSVWVFRLSRLRLTSR